MKLVNGYVIYLKPMSCCKSIHISIHSKKRVDVKPTVGYWKKKKKEERCSPCNVNQNTHTHGKSTGWGCWATALPVLQLQLVTSFQSSCAGQWTQQAVLAGNPLNIQAHSSPALSNCTGQPMQIGIKGENTQWRSECVFQLDWGWVYLSKD